MNTQVVNYVQIVMNLKLNGVKSLPSTRDEQRGIIKGRGTQAFERECEEEHEDHDSSLCLLITMEGMNSIDIRWSWIWNFVIRVLHNQRSGQQITLAATSYNLKVKMGGGGGRVQGLGLNVQHP